MIPTITIDTRVADIVVANPAAAQVFERHRIDYCCNGRRPLADACADAGLEPTDVIAELEQLGTATSDSAPIGEIGALIGHIVATHHTSLRRELPRLGDLMDKVIAAHGTAHPEVHDVAALLHGLTDDLLPHLTKEEQVLFPLAIQLLGAVEPTDFHCGSILDPIRVMHTEHDRAGGLLAALREQTDDYTPPDDACPTWRALYAGLADLEADTHRHVHLENNILFPAIAALERRLSAARTMPSGFQV
jgi:regulator of cell morphogenesis and NO signaling